MCRYCKQVPDSYYDDDPPEANGEDGPPEDTT